MDTCCSVSFLARVDHNWTSDEDTSPATRERDSEMRACRID